MSEFWNGVFRDSNAQSRRLIRDVQAATQPATATGAGARVSAATPTAYPSTQHADVENIQVALYDTDPYDDDHFVYG